ncbi:MAG: hypothetical protein N2258_03385 [Brevinematales bacterium]|nr:hypothetical protein [Brevinematales bacterium]
MKEKQLIFKFSLYMRVYGAAILGLMGFAYLLLIFIPVGDFFSLITVDKNDYLFISIFAIGLIPFTFIGFYLFYRHSGCVILNQKAIILKRFGKEKEILYSNIFYIGFTNFHIPEGIIIKSQTSTLSFSTQIENYPELWKILKKKVFSELLKPERLTFPFYLSFTSQFWFSKILQFCGLIAILFGIVAILGGVGKTGKFDWGIGGFLILLSLSIIIAAVIIELSPNQFAKIIFTEQDIKGYYINGKTKSWPVSNLNRISFNEKKRWFYVDGVEGYAPQRSVMLNFEKYPPLIIFDKRIRDFGYNAEWLYICLNYLYNAQLSKKISPQK